MVVAVAVHTLLKTDRMEEAGVVLHMVLQVHQEQGYPDKVMLAEMAIIWIVPVGVVALEILDIQRRRAAE
jgi:hypothetical protein